MKPFDLQAALNGAKVVTRDGREVRIAGYNEDCNSLLGWVGNGVYKWTGGGINVHDENDLFMAPTGRKEWVVRWDTNICVICKTKESAQYMADNHKDIGIPTIQEIIVID